MNDWEGFVDLISPQEIAGWVRRVASEEPVDVEIVQADRVLGNVTADILRADLAEAGKGSGRHGFSFRFGLDATGDSEPSPIQVRVRDSTYIVPMLEKPAPPSPEIPPAIPTGLVERLSRLGLTGWAWRPGSDERLTIEAVVNDVVVASTVADNFRADLLAAGVGDGKHAFQLRAPAAGFAVESAVVRVKDGPLLKLLPQEIGGNASDEAAGAIASRVHAVEGFIERLNVREVAGWAWKPPTDERVELEILVDDQVVARTRADIERPELADAGIGDGRHGFHLSFNRSITGRERAVVRPLGRPPLPRLPQVDAKLAPPVPSEGVPAAPPDPAEPADPGAAAAPAAAAIPADAAELVMPAADAARALAEGAVKKPKLAVVAWDLAHNPVGRAFALADMAARTHEVELVGPIFEIYGGRIWPPLADAPLRMRGFTATDLRSLVAGAMELARGVTCDIVHVSKPRLPSLLVGALIRKANDCPMLVDIDDDELSFVKDPRPASFEDVELACRGASRDIDIPHSDLWTRFAETLLEEADGITVSNVALRRRFGGVMVRHARNELIFDPEKCDRGRVRAEFGYRDSDRVILFLGTAREHKGIIEIAEALERLADDRLAFCIVGRIPDKQLLARLSAYTSARVVLHPDQSWQRLPQIMSMADCVLCLQDPKHAISQFQIPAKLTDALALGVPVLATPVAPLEDVALAGAIDTVRDEAELDAALKRLARSPPRAPRGTQGRHYFLSELSYAVNAARLDVAFAAAAANRASALPRFERLFRLLESRTDVTLPRLSDTPRRRERRSPICKDAPPVDMVFLWKQNDSDIYGRRSDMVAKYLQRTGRVRRVVHFDAPVSVADLEWQTGEPAIYVNTVERILCAADAPNFLRRTFLYRNPGEPDRALGRKIPPREAYPEFVQKTLRDAGVSGAPLLWVCPIVFDLPAIADAIRPSFIVADIIDDQRLFPHPNLEHRRRVADEYEVILRESDAVFTNCQPIREAFAGLRSDIHVVPNGAEAFPDAHLWPASEQLAGLPRPIIGYVGNLRDRVDLGLLEAIATRFPEATVVLVGSTRGRPEVPDMAARLPNMRLLGVQPYEEAQRIIRSFDVAIMPHLKSELSDHMNPLKLYVYFSLGVPVVSTAVANIGDLSARITVAQGSEAFLDAIAAALSGNAHTASASARDEILKSISWEARVAEIWRLLELQPESPAPVAARRILRSVAQRRDLSAVNPPGAPRTGDVDAPILQD
jgi:glycosyltransferase involved in cell wall biosynthesis